MPPAMMEHINWSRAKRGNRVEMDDTFPSVLQVEILPSSEQNLRIWISTS